MSFVTDADRERVAALFDRAGDLQVDVVLLAERFEGLDDPVADWFYDGLTRAGRYLLSAALAMKPLLDGEGAEEHAKRHADQALVDEAMSVFNNRIMRRGLDAA